MANLLNGAYFLLSMWFHQDLRKQIHSMIRSIEKDELSIPDNWQWMEQREHRLEHIEDEDIVLIRELQDLHNRGLDVPELSLRIITKAQQLKDHIKVMESNRGLDPKTQKQELDRLRSFTQEIDSLFQQEIRFIKESQERAIHEGRGRAVPKKCIAFFSAEASKSESAGEDFTKFLSRVGRDPNRLYKYLRARFSGFVGDEALIRDYIRGSKRNLWDKLKLELNIIEKEVPRISGVQYKSGAGWNHFVLNGDAQQHRSFKAYISLDYHTFTAKAFISAVQVLVKSGFRGQIKTCQPESVGMLFQQDDNIVIHGDEPHLVTRGAQIVTKILEQNGVHIGGGSRSSKFNIAQDFMVPDLQLLGKKTHKTSFSEGIAEIACEIILQAINGSKKYLKSYPDFINFLVKLYADNGPFVQYVQRANIFL
ncbi:hypothetical protein JW968_03970 [Candidatus Woesearchaeota archaeon]|nr:hypothetical protein [Candidatus Woesearchaeota archaeon]